MAVAESLPWVQIVSIYNFSSMFSFNAMSMHCESIIFFPSSTAVGLLSFSTSSSYSDLPIRAPSATAIGRPIMSVPGMPTPMAFFRILALRNTLMCSGRQPRVSVALATHNATAIGSVQPIAGTTSLFIRAMICSLSGFAIMLSIR